MWLYRNENNIKSRLVNYVNRFFRKLDKEAEEEVKSTDRFKTYSEDKSSYKYSDGTYNYFLSKGYPGSTLYNLNKHNKQQALNLFMFFNKR